MRKFWVVVYIRLLSKTTTVIKPQLVKAGRSQIKYNFKKIDNVVT